MYTVTNIDNTWVCTSHYKAMQLIKALRKQGYVNLFITTEDDYNV